MNPSPAATRLGTAAASGYRMQPYPHRYRVAASAETEGDVTLSSQRLPDLSSAPPEEFDGTGDRWSPETLLVAAVADCFVLTFRAVARASGLGWSRLRVAASGTLDRVEGGPRFIAMEVSADLTVPEGVDEERARRLLEKAERGCLVTRSLACPSELVARVERSSG